MEKYKTSKTLVNNVKAVLERREIQFEIIEEDNQKYILTELNGNEFHKIVVRAKMERIKIERGLPDDYPDFIALSEVSDLVVMKEIECKNGNQAYSIVDAPANYYDYPENWVIEKKEPSEANEEKLKKIYEEKDRIFKTDINLKSKEQIRKLLKLSIEAAEIEFELMDEFYTIKEMIKAGMKVNECEDFKEIDKDYAHLERICFEDEKDFLGELSKFELKYF